MFKKISTSFWFHALNMMSVEVGFLLSMLFRTLSVRNVGELGKNTLVFSSGLSVLPYIGHIEVGTLD